jgi:toxin ParE1/3/4
MARLDLDEIVDYISRDNAEAARRWLKSTMDEFLRLAKNPLIGQERNDLRPEVRSISYGNYVVYFRSRGDFLDIVRVLHGARDIFDL